jgi:hypothetical protein
VATAPARACSGDPGPYNANGYPDRLPQRIQLGGVAYNLAGIADPAEAGTLTPIGCVGAFTAVSSDQEAPNEVLYLRFDAALAGQASLFRYEVGATFSVEFEVDNEARRVASADQAYNLTQTWEPSVYSSVTVVLYAADPAESQPGRIYARRVDASAIGEYVPEGELAQPAEEVVAAAQAAGINPDLTLNGARYVLAAVWTPIGTSPNGFVTFFGPQGQAAPDRVLGIDPRQIGLLIYGREGA